MVPTPTDGFVVTEVQSSPPHYEFCRSNHRFHRHSMVYEGTGEEDSLDSDSCIDSSSSSIGSVDCSWQATGLDDSIDDSEILTSRCFKPNERSNGGSSFFSKEMIVDSFKHAKSGALGSGEPFASDVATAPVCLQLCGASNLSLNANESPGLCDHPSSGTPILSNSYVVTSNLSSAKCLLSPKNISFSPSSPTSVPLYKSPQDVGKPSRCLKIGNASPSFSEVIMHPVIDSVVERVTEIISSRCIQIGQNFI